MALNEDKKGKIYQLLYIIMNFHIECYNQLSNLHKDLPRSYLVCGAEVDSHSPEV